MDSQARGFGVVDDGGSERTSNHVSILEFARAEFGLFVSSNYDGDKFRFDVLVV